MVYSSMNNHISWNRSLAVKIIRVAFDISALAESKYKEYFCFYGLLPDALIYSGTAGRSKRAEIEIKILPQNIKSCIPQ